MVFIWKIFLHMFWLLPIFLNITGTLLPPASEGWGKVLFSVCLSVHILGWGYPSQIYVGGTPSQVWVGGVPCPWSGQGGYPIPGLALGYTIPCLAGRYPISGQGYPTDQVWMGVPMVPPIPRPEMGYPPPITQSSIASTCYVEGGVPLAFTQEDFLVLK